MALAPAFIATLAQGAAIAAASAAISYLLTPSPEDQEGPRLDDLTATSSAYGKFRTIAYGRISNPGNIIGASDLKETRHKNKSGGKGGKSSTYYSYTYRQDIALGLGEPVDLIEKIYANEKLIYDFDGETTQPDWLNLKFYLGGEDQLPDPTLQALYGVDETPAYRGEAYIVFKDFELEDFGNRTPTFRVITTSGADIETANKEYRVNSNFYPGSTSEAFMTTTATDEQPRVAANGYQIQHPASGNIFYEWDQITPSDPIPDDWTDNPLLTVVNPNSLASTQYNIHIDHDVAPDDDDDEYRVMGGQLTLGQLGELHKYRYPNDTIVMSCVRQEYSESLEGWYSREIQIYGWSGDHGGQFAKATLLDSMNTYGGLSPNAMSIWGPFNKTGTIPNRFVGLYQEDNKTTYLRIWELCAARDCGELNYLNSQGSRERDPDDPDEALYKGIPFEPTPGWRHANVRIKGDNNGSALIYGEDDDLAAETGSPGILTKINDHAAIEWTVPVDTDFISAQQDLALYNATYDETRDCWWSIYNGKIWSFANSTTPSHGGGETRGIWDVSEDPEYIGMSSRVCINKYKKGGDTFGASDIKLYWAGRQWDAELGSNVTVIQSWDAATLGEEIDHNLTNYPVDEPLENQNFSPRSILYNPYKNAVYVGTNSATRTSPHRAFLLNKAFADDTRITLAEILADVCTRCGLASDEYDVSDCETTMVEGYHIAKLMSGRACITPLQHGYLFDSVDTGGKIKFIIKGKDSIATIPRDDLGATTELQKPSVFVETNRMMEHQLPKYVNIGYIDPASMFEPGLQKAERVASRNTNTVKLTLPISFSGQEARDLADKILHLTHIERESYKFSTMPKWQLLEAADVIDVEGENEYFRARITKTYFEKGIKKIEAVREEQDSYTVPAAVVADVPIPRDDVVEVPGITEFELFDIPLLREQDDDPGFYAGATSTSETWPGAVIYKSLDDVSFGEAAVFTEKTSYGFLTSPLPRRNGLHWDTENTIHVQMVVGELDGTTKERVLQGYNSLIIGKYDLSDWEIINFKNCEEVADGVYKLTNLIRSRLGTDWLEDVGFDLEMNSLVVPANTDNLEYIEDIDGLNRTAFYKAVSIGVNLNNPTNPGHYHYNSGTCLVPYAPTHVRGEKITPSYDVVVTWMPRTRYPMRDFWSGSPSEPGDQRFKLQFYDSENNLKRTSTVTGLLSHTYERWAQILHVGVTPQQMRVVVTHLSERTTTSYAGEGIIDVGFDDAMAYCDAVDYMPSTICHFKVDEDHSEVVDGKVATDSTGNVTDAVYNQLISTPGSSWGIDWHDSNVPSNIAEYPNDKCLHMAEHLNQANIETSDNIFNTGDEFSVSFVATIRASKSSSELIERNGQFQIYWVAGSNYRKLRFQVSGTGGDHLIQSNSGKLDDPEEPRHYVFTAKGSTNTLKIYINGVQSNGSSLSDSISSIDQPTSTSLKIAPEYVYLDDFAFHDEELTQSEVEWLFNQTGLTA